MSKDILEATLTETIGKFDPISYTENRKELETISQALPKDGTYSIQNLQNLQRLCIRGMNICDHWITVLHVQLSECESDRDYAKNSSYLNAKGDSGKMTAEAKKAFSECDDDFLKNKKLAEKIKAAKSFLEKKRETFKTAIFVFRDRLLSYKISDKGSDGETLTMPEEEMPGKVGW